MPSLMREPNSFISYWTAKELRDWLKENRWRYRYKNPVIYPDAKSWIDRCVAEMKRRRMKERT